MTIRKCPIPSACTSTKGPARRRRCTHRWVRKTPTLLAPRKRCSFVRVKRILSRSKAHTPIFHCQTLPISGFMRHVVRSLIYLAPASTCAGCHKILRKPESYARMARLPTPSRLPYNRMAKKLYSIIAHIFRHLSFTWTPICPL